MIVRILCSFLVLALFLLAELTEFAGARQTMTLPQCVQAGVENNPSLQASKIKADSAGREVKMARADFLPSLTSSYSQTRLGNVSAKGSEQTDFINQDIRSTNVRLVQILYAGSRISNSHDKAKILEQATQAESELNKLELGYNIETTFYKVMKAKQDVISAEEAVSRLTESVKAAEAFFRRELVPQVDVLKARVDLDDANNQLSIAKNNELRMRVTLFSLMNLPMDPDTEFVDGDPLVKGAPPSFESCFQSAVEHRPDIKNLGLQRQAADKQASVALGKYLPTVRLETGYFYSNNDFVEPSSFNSNRDTTNRYWQAGLTVSWELFDGGRAWYENEKYGLETQRYGALIRDMHNTIATGIRKALYSMAEAEQRMAGSSAALTAATENYTAEDNRLKAGVSTITALLDAQSRLVRAKSNAANATLDYQLALSELKLLTGGQNRL